MKTRIYNEGQLIKERLAEISDYIYNNPELGNEEYKAVEALTTFLKDIPEAYLCPPHPNFSATLLTSILLLLSETLISSSKYLIKTETSTSDQAE